MKFIKILGAVTLINIIARLLGFVREMVIGFQYGTSYYADSIITAFTIPNFFYIVLGGAVTTTVISIASKLEPKRQQAFIDTMTSGLIMLMGVVTLILMFFAEQWLVLFFGGLSDEALTLTTQLFRLMAPATFFLVLAMFYSGLLNMHEKYRLTSLSTLLFNAGFLLFSVALSVFLGPIGYGFGATLGAVLMCGFLIYFLYRFRYLSRFRFKLMYTEDVSRFIKLVLPIVFGGATLQFYYLIQRVFASNLSEGVIASLNYASKLTQFPQAVLMASVTTVIYPLLAKAAGEQDFNKLHRVYQRGVQTLLILLIPVTIALVIYAEEAVTFIFQYGSFDRKATELTYPLLQILSLTMMGLALNTYITRFFYALERSVMAIVLNVVSVFGINVGLVYLWLETYEERAIAMAMVISTLANTLMLMGLIYNYYGFTMSSWMWLLKLLLFTTASVVVLYGVSLIPVSIVILRLIIAGVTSLALIGLGYKWLGQSVRTVE